MGVTDLTRMLEADSLSQFVQAVRTQPQQAPINTLNRLTSSHTEDGCIRLASHWLTQVPATDFLTRTVGRLPRTRATRSWSDIMKTTQCGTTQQQEGMEKPTGSQMTGKNTPTPFCLTLSGQRTPN